MADEEVAVELQSTEQANEENANEADYQSTEPAEEQAEAYATEQANEENANALASTYPSNEPSAPTEITYANEDVSSSLQGKYLELEIDGKICNFNIKSIGDAPKDTTSADFFGPPAEKLKERTKTMEQIMEEEKQEEIFSLVPDSTNAWLYIEDGFQKEDEDGETKSGCLANCGDSVTNKFIALFVLCLQIAAYITMVVFLGAGRNKEFKSRKESCYGPNCNAEPAACMELTTGGLTSILLVGFLWADVVNTMSIMTRSCRYATASIFVLAELITAIVCGFLVGVYSESDFDAIGGAVGILFVHDLDEKVFASMQVFRGQSYATLKKAVAIILWIVLSFVVALTLACEYNNGTFFGTCKRGEYECTTGSECIWEGFVCNGVKDCKDESDEGEAAGCDYALKNYCPDDKFECVEDGSCIDASKRCDGNLDCPDGSDEGRAQNCSEVIAQKKCSTSNFNVTDKYPDANDTYHKYWSGKFKCNNGQCIDAQYACDGQTGDCVDGSDEYPFFYKGKEWPFERACPYAQLIECEADETLCKINGQCISKGALCDGINDCPDGADETLCDYSCQNKVKSLSDFQCGGKFAFLNKTHYQLFTPNVSANATDEEKFVKYTTKSALNTFFTNATGACIPIQWRCDGTNDCDDGTDENECGLFSCSDSEYQCTDTGSCIPKSWLCDGVNDCDNKEDENKAICLQNGASVSSDECTEQGFYYQCQGFSDICLYEYNMCDGYQDCPNDDDEIQENCDAAASASGSTGGSTGGTATCGSTVTDTGYSSDSHTFSFTMPSDMTELKISTCLTENQGETFIYLYDSSGTYLYSNYDSSCGCQYRSVILGKSSGADEMTSYTVTPGTTYTLELYQYFTGTYAVKIECKASGTYSEGGTCSGGNIGGYNPSSTYNGFSNSNTGSGGGITTGSGGVSGTTGSGGGVSGTTGSGGGVSGTTGSGGGVSGTTGSGGVPGTTN